MILSTGNVGYHLATRADEINTYLSRDGGNTWNEVNLFITYPLSIFRLEKVHIYMN